MLHSTKSQSILQWYNALTSNVDVESLSQFADGSLFCDIVDSVYLQAQIENPVPKLKLPESDESLKDDARTDTEGSSSTQAESMETSEDPSTTAEDSSEKKYELIKKFIDNFFQMDSSTIISYSGCMQAKDLELAKVAVLLLSAMVQNMLSSNNETLQTITLLEANVQEDIKECLSLLLERSDKDAITKGELHKALGKPTKAKATPRRKTSHRSTSESADTPSKRSGRQRVAAIVYEDAQESPLKGLLQSPNNSQHRAAIAIFKKETELSKLRNALYSEEMKTVDLRLEKKEMSEELLKKKEEIDFIKSEFRQHKEMTEEREAHYSMERANLSEEMVKLNNLLQEKDEEIKSLQTEQNGYINTISDLEEKLLQKGGTSGGGADTYLTGLHQKIRELESMSEYRGSVMQEYVNQIATLEKDVIEYKQMYEEQLSRRETPKMSPPTRETVGNIHYADAKDTVEKLQEKEKEVQKLKNLNRNIKIQLKEKTENIQAVLDKLSNLQDKHEKLLQKSRACTTCGTSLESEDDASRESTGKLWDKSEPRATRSKSTGHPSTSTPLGSTAVSRLKTLLRCFCLQLVKWNFIGDNAVVAKADFYSRNIDTVDDYIKSFEQILHILKRVMPAVSATVQTEMKAIKELEVDSPEEELEKTKKRFSTMVSSMKLDLATFKAEAKAAKEENKKLQLLKETAEKERAEMDVNLKSLQAKYDGLRKGLMKYKMEKKNLEEQCVDLQDELIEIKRKAENCTRCEGYRKKIEESKSKLQESDKEVDGLTSNIKDLLYKIKSLERRVTSLIEEKEKLEDKIQHNNAFLFGSSSARNALINKYYQKSLAESKKKAIPDLEDLESEDSQPHLSVNNFFLCPENKTKKDHCPETSISSHIGNRSIKSAYLQTEDEEDFLNHSSLSQIQGGYLEPQDRLQELQRRNTLVPRHLQSSYPLEIQDMTPSERKYSMLPSQFEASGSGEASKKRKVSEIETSMVQTGTRKALRTSTVSKAPDKPRTPLRQTYKLAKSFKTPSSIRRLMRIPSKKNKQQ